MSEREPRDMVGLARKQLVALSVSLEQDDAASVSRETARELRSILQMLDKLQSRFGLLEEVLDRTNDIVFAKDLDGHYVMINPRGAAVFGKLVAEVLGADDQALFQASDAKRIMATDREIMRSGVQRSGEETYFVLGGPLTLVTTTTAWHDGAGQVCGVIGIAQDVTERRRSEREDATDRERLRSTIAETVLSEERLRRTLAVELHNGLGQDIALTKLKLSVLRGSLDDALQAPLGRIVQLVDQAHESLLSITFQISPPSLHDLGLVAALQWLGEDIGRKHGCTVRIEDGSPPSVADESVRAILFRAVREVLVTCAPHAHGREVVVHLERQGNQIRITLSGLGLGVDGAGVDHRDGALFGLREQLRYVNGSLQIASEPVGGTQVILTAPSEDLLADSTA